MQAVLLTDWRGPLGHALVAELSVAGIRTSVLVTAPGVAPRGWRGHAVVNVAETGWRTLADLMSSVDTVIDNRCIPASGRSAGALCRRFVQDTEVLVSAASAAGVRRLVFAGPAAVPDRVRAHGYRRARRMMLDAARRGTTVSVVLTAPLFGPEPGVSTDLNALVVNVIAGRMPVVSSGATNLLYAGDAAKAVVDVARAGRSQERLLVGSRHRFKLISDLVASQVGHRTSWPLPGVLARPILRVVSGVVPGSSIHFPASRFESVLLPSGHGGQLARSLLSADLAGTVDHFRALLPLDAA